MSLINTLMQPLRTQYQGALDKNEARPSRYGAWDYANQDSKSANSIFTPDIRSKIKNSQGNTVVVPVLDAKDVTIGNVRSCTIADDENTSQLVTLVAASFAFGFTMYPGQYKNNDVKYEADFTRKLSNYLNKFGATLDSAAITALENAKNQHWANIAAYYPQVGDALQVTQAQKNDYYNRLQAIHETMDFYNPVKIIQSTSGQPMVNRLDNQGAGNGINEQFQMGGYQWFNSNRIANGIGVESTHYSVTEGNMAVESRVDVDAMAGSKVGDQMEWGTAMVPIPGSANGIEMGTFSREDCADASALHGGTAHLPATMKQSFQWSADVFFAFSYNSDIANRYSPVIKTEISAT